MLLICPVRPGDSNEELRYALRSWETNLHFPGTDYSESGELRLLTVGYKPTWLTPDEHVDGNHYKSVCLAVFDNIRLASEAAFWTDEAIYMNDDFFCLDPVGSVLPVKRNITLAEHIAKFPPNAGLWWPRSLDLTASFLAEAGFPRPDSYELHRPLLASPRAMFEALSKVDGPVDGLLPQWRTLYGVLNEVDAYPVRDVKLGSHTTGVGTPWISTSDLSWRRYARELTKRFRKPSRWED